MSDITVRTRPAIDIPLLVVAIGLTLLVAFTARGALATTHAGAPTAAPLVSPTENPSLAPAVPPPKKDDHKGHG